MKNIFKLKSKGRIYREMIIASFIPGICSVLILSAVFLPLLTGTARKNDSAYENNILYSVEVFFEMLNTSAEDVKNQVEKSEWLHDVYINQIINGASLNYDVKRAVLSDLTLLTAKSKFMKGISIQYYENKEIVFTNKGVFDNLKYYQENFPEKIYYFFFPSQTDTGFFAVDFNGEGYLVYSVPITDIEGGKQKGEINIVFDSDKLHKYLHEIADNNISCVRIVDDESGNVWEYRLSQEDKTVTLLNDSAEKIKVQVDIPKSVHNRTSRRMMPFIAATVLFDLAACILLAYTFSRRNYRPVETIVKKFGVNVSKQDNEFESLNHMLDQILLEKSETEDSLEYLGPLAQQKVISNLLDNPTFVTGAYSEEQLNHCNIKFKYCGINVAAVQVPFSKLNIKGTKNVNQAAEIAMQTITGQLCGRFGVIAYLYQEDLDRYKIIINYDDPEILQMYIASLEENCNQCIIKKEKASEPIFIGVGNEVKSSSEIYYAAEQASTVRNYCIINRNLTVAFYSEIESQINHNYSYPLSDEILLTHAITEGNADAAKAVLRKIIDEVSSFNQYSETSLQLLYANLFFTVMRSAQNIGITAAIDINLIKDEKRPVTLAAIEKTVENKIDEICKKVQTILQEAIVSEEDQIIKYIDENIFNPDLSLNHIADRYCKSITYISILFKNKKGVNYTDYVNKTRIDKAVELFSNTAMDMDSVYHAVGYVSVSTFRRNFIKYMKQNPGDFVNSVRESR